MVYGGIEPHPLAVYGVASVDVPVQVVGGAGPIVCLVHGWVTGGRVTFHTYAVPWESDTVSPVIHEALLPRRRGWYGMRGHPSSTATRSRRTWSDRPIILDAISRCAGVPRSSICVST